MATAAPDDTSTDAAEDVAEPSDAEAQAAAQAAASRMKKIKAAGLVVGLSLVMMAVGYFFMPESKQQEDPEMTADAEAGGVVNRDIEELEIGQFNCTNSKVGPDVNIHINFTLSASVLAKNKQALKEAKDKYQARIRDAVNTVARSASRDDLNDPHLNTIKRSIREEINRIIHEHYIIEIVIPDWQTMER